MVRLSHKLSTINHKLFKEAKRYIPGGVNSPVRSFKAVGGYPIFIKAAQAARLFGECGREFIDYCLSWGALILGHSHPEVVKTLKETVVNGFSFGAATKLETELARLISEAMPSIERLRLTNSGTEAVMVAIRLARAYTRKNKIIKFTGSYHGHADYLLDSPGVPTDFKKYTLLCSYNNLEKVEEIIKKESQDLAAIIVEPVACNMGVVLPKNNFLQSLRNLTNQYKIVLIFDEVITAFRLIYGGAQRLFNIKPDLTCLGKIMGGGLPMGALGGRKEIMGLLAPLGDVFQAGTFSGNPISVSAGLATLKVLSRLNPYPQLERRTQNLCTEIKQKAKDYGLKIKINTIGSVFSIFFTDKEIIDYNTAITQDTDLFKRFYHSLLKEGIYLSPSGFEANFLSTAHTEEDLKQTLMAVERSFENLRRNQDGCSYLFKRKKRRYS